MAVSETVLLLEPRILRIFTVGPAGPELLREPVACRMVDEHPVTDALLDATGWPCVHHAGRGYIVGRPAVDLARILPGTSSPLYPLAAADAPEELGETVLRALIAHCLGLPRPRRFRVVVLLASPTAPQEDPRLRELPGRALSDLGIAHTQSSILHPLMADTPSDRLEWGWVIGERGTAIGACYRGERRECGLDRGWSMIAPPEAERHDGKSVAETPRAPDGASPATRLRLGGLLQDAAGIALGLFRDAWAHHRSPAIRLTAVAPDGLLPEVSAALPDALDGLGIRPPATAVIPCGRLLERAWWSARGTPRATAVHGLRPQAIRPRRRGGLN